MASRCNTDKIEKIREGIFPDFLHPDIEKGRGKKKLRQRIRGKNIAAA